MLKKLFTTTALHNTDNDSAEVPLVTPSICGGQAKRQHNGQFANKLLLVFVAIWAEESVRNKLGRKKLYKTVCVSAAPKGKFHKVVNTW